MIAVLLMALAAADPGAPMDYGNLVSEGGMTFTWHIEGDTLHGVMAAPTTGWVAVGFNDRRQLAGTRLVMGAVRDGTVVVEEHKALVPDHVRTRALPSEAVSGREATGSSEVHFAIPLDPGASDQVRIAAGAAIHLTLAWSRSDDFFHHSAMRTAVDVTL